MQGGRPHREDSSPYCRPAKRQKVRRLDALHCYALVVCAGMKPSCECTTPTGLSHSANIQSGRYLQVNGMVQPEYNPLAESPDTWGPVLALLARR